MTTSIFNIPKSNEIIYKITENTPLKVLSNFKNKPLLDKFYDSSAMFIIHSTYCIIAATKISLLFTMYLPVCTVAGLSKSKSYNKFKEAVCKPIKPLKDEIYSTVTNAGLAALGAILLASSTIDFVISLKNN
jgi:hypothetical protein